MNLSKSLSLILMGCMVLALVPSAQAGVLEDVMVFELSGAQESNPVATGASGMAVAVLNPLQTSLTVMVTHDVVGATAAHIHGPADPGTDAGVLFNLGDAASPIVATWDNISVSQVAELLDGKYYINVHSPDYPAGEIRGQIVDEGNPITYNFRLSGAQEVDPVVESTSGMGAATLNGSRTELEVTVTHDVTDATAAHIHGPAPMGVNAGVIVNLGEPASPIMAVWDDITPAEIFDLVSGLHYVNVHSPDHPGGEIRGQILNSPPKPFLSCHAGSGATNASVGDMVVLLMLLGGVTLTALLKRQGAMPAAIRKR